MDQFKFLTDLQAKQLLREVLLEYSEEVSIHRSSEETQPQIVDLDGLIKARPFVGSKSTIYKKACKGCIPHSKNGKRLIFNLKDIDVWLLSNRIPTSNEIEAKTMSALVKH